VRFTFAGAEYEGTEGQTLAAALVANGVLDGFRSIYRGRPRGVFAAGEEEPNAFVRVADEPRARATLVELEEGLVAEPVDGKGRLGLPLREARHDAVNAHCDVLVVGAGDAGRAAATAADGDVILVEQRRCAPLDGVRTLERTTAIGIYEGNLVVAVERGRRLWRIRTRRVVLATGAVEQPALFPDNDRPGVMLADAFERYGRPQGATPVSGGWAPRVELWSQAGGRLAWDDRVGAPVPAGALPAVECVGTITGERLPQAPPFALPDGDEETMFVDLERDATVADVRRAVAAGLHAIEHVKRFTTIGTGSDQGKTANVLAIRVAAELLGIHPGELGTTTYRPPTVPVSFALLAGRNRGRLFDPERVTPMHERHVELGAVFENVGQWKRPRYYPRADEDMEASVMRECGAVREHVGLQDVSTLGKIDVQGPDAAELLDRLYTNVISTLPVGMCRYGLMCRADGMVFDDGVVMRVGEQRYVCTTTTGNAEAVLSWLEEWAQTEWPDLRVSLTSVTEQWATVAVAGPDARALLQPLTTVALDAESFPFMAIREGEVAGIPARICRVSFSGELAFEVSVDGRRGLDLWLALERAGEATPYGTEAMHVLRAEKAYPIVGQDTDGTVTPHDLGMSWIVSKTKEDFVGKRSFSRADTRRPDRKQLVAVLPVDPHELLPEGAQLVADPAGVPPVPMLGHVTSSYRSGALGRTFALALVSGGRERLGETVFAPLENRVVEAVLEGPVLYDPEGRRRDGRAA
jgi:sarcosine oxidase subunit alpha